MRSLKVYLLMVAVLLGLGLPVGADDFYEPNDDFSAAWPLEEQTYYTLFSENDDYFEVVVDPGFGHLTVRIDFSHAEGDLDLYVYDAGYNLVGTSVGISNTELVELDLPPGLYYVQVTNAAAFTGQTYLLWWDDEPGSGGLPDDAYEDNDFQGEAVQIEENVTYGGLISADDDWWEIYVDPDYEYLKVLLRFNPAAGQIYASVYDGYGRWVMDSYPVVGGEEIVGYLPGPGWYYIRIRGDYAGNEYSLWWDDSYSGAHDNGSAVNVRGGCALGNSRLGAFGRFAGLPFLALLGLVALVRVRRGKNPGADRPAPRGKQGHPEVSHKPK